MVYYSWLYCFVVNSKTVFNNNLYKAHFYMQPPTKNSVWGYNSELTSQAQPFPGKCLSMNERDCCLPNLGKMKATKLVLTLMRIWTIAWVEDFNHIHFFQPWNIRTLSGKTIAWRLHLVSLEAQRLANKVNCWGRPTTLLKKKRAWTPVGVIMRALCQGVAEAPIVL